jgi:hypothetical protein
MVSVPWIRIDDHRYWSECPNPKRTASFESHCNAYQITRPNSGEKISCGILRTFQKIDTRTRIALTRTRQQSAAFRPTQINRGPGHSQRIDQHARMPQVLLACRI